ncbi:MAG: hypothetical protein J6U31_06295, partial [Bacteroidales bacterium]|nr:hypothetical protein [Bacteroidales bacterium]
MENLEPQALWAQFEQICRIPHPSGHLDALRTYIIRSAESAGFSADTDEAGNIRVLMPATQGWEHRAAEQQRDLQQVTTL